MKSIALIVPYFGHLPNNFALWLESCRYNSTINWIIFTDDKTEYSYPPNVKVIYITFNKLQERIQSHYDFKINIDKPYRLCDFRPAYGDIFYDELKSYDFWGYCDIDVIWGNIRKFITEQVLNQYTKIGFQGHLTLYRNDSEVNMRYKLPVNGIELYKQAFESNKSTFFDESGISDIYRYDKIPFYQEVHFANISPLKWSFYLRYFPQTDDYKNKHQIFTWDKGVLTRLFVYDGSVHKEEFMYIHFLRRSMKIQIDSMNSIVIYPNIIQNKYDNITCQYISKKSKNDMLKYYLDLVKRKRKKISLKNVYIYFAERIKAKKRIKNNNETIM